MRSRRQFISLLGGGAAAWPLVARAQQPDRLRRIGVLMGYAETDPEAQARLKSFLRGLQDLGWIDKVNMQLDYRWGAGNVARIQALAKELLSLQPDVILANTTPVIRALQHETRKLPIVFVVSSDPVGDGFVASLARPGGNITGFINYEASMAGKWLELLHEIAPSVTRASLMYNPDTAPGGGAYFLPSFEGACRSLGLKPQARPVRTSDDIETAIAELQSEPRGGLVTGFDGFTVVHRGAIMSLSARRQVPVVYPLREFSIEGGLASYGPDYLDMFQRAASYVDRILKGATPAELPVQIPTKFQLVVNLKAAKAIGIEVPPMLLVRADEVIE